MEIPERNVERRETELNAEARRRREKRREIRKLIVAISTFYRRGGNQKLALRPSCTILPISFLSCKCRYRDNQLADFSAFSSASLRLCVLTVSRRQTVDLPDALFQNVLKTIVKPVGAPLPKFKALRNQPKPSPKWWFWNALIAKALVHLAILFL